MGEWGDLPPSAPRPLRLTYVSPAGTQGHLGDARARGGSSGLHRSHGHSPCRPFRAQGNVEPRQRWTVVAATCQYSQPMIVLRQ